MVTTANPLVGRHVARVDRGDDLSLGLRRLHRLDVGAGVSGDVPAKHYRYKVFDTLIPLRNMVWRSA